MKNLKYILFTVMVGFFLTSCEDDIDKVFISENPTSPSLEKPTGISYTKDDANNPVEFTWTKADFGYPASITYGVQISPDADFEERATLVTSQKLSGTTKVNAINSSLISWKFPIGEPASVNIRVFATVGAGTDSVFSETGDYTITPYEDLPEYPMIYVPGSYQGWSPGDENGRLYSYESSSRYEGILRLDGDDPVAFKIAPAPNWDNSWGGSLTAAGNGYSGTLDPSGGDFFAAAGTYMFVVNVSDLTIEMTKTDNWGVIGSSIPPYDWSEDVDMTYNGQRQMWEITGDFKAGEFKFRANDGWDLNYGDFEADGSLDAGGDNIELASDGNYTIRLDLINNTYKVLKN